MGARICRSRGVLGSRRHRGVHAMNNDEIQNLLSRIEAAIGRLDELDRTRAAARSIAADCARESAEKVEAQRLLNEACRVLASIATADASSADDVIADAQAFFRVNELPVSDYVGSPQNAQKCSICGSTNVDTYAFARWDPAKNPRFRGGVSDDAICNTCGSETHVSDLFRVEP